MDLQQLHVDQDGFRLRGGAGSRVDNFSDFVFAFAFTLIVAAQAVPQTFNELRAVLLGFVPFGVCFLLFVLIWLAHYRFFRRYGLHDERTTWINFLLLFTVLLYIYPLKFLFTLALVSRPGVLASPYQLRELMVVYGAGFAAIQFCFVLLYGNAWLRRRQLRLNPLETTLTLLTLRSDVGNAAVGLTCCLLARLLPPSRAGDAGYSFLLLFVWGRTHAFLARRRIARARVLTLDAERAGRPGAAETRGSSTGEML